MATGKQGLRGIHDSRDGSLVGLKMHLRLRDAQRTALERRVELFMLDRSYVGLELVEGRHRQSLSRDDAREAGATGRLRLAGVRAHLVAGSPQLAAHLENAEPLFDKPLAVVCPANGHLDDEAEPEAYRIGDRLAHIPPFTGDGLAIAVASGVLAAQHIMQGLPPAAYLAAARALTARPIRLASIISRLAANRAGRALIIAGDLVPGLVAGVVRKNAADRRSLANTGPKR